MNIQEIHNVFLRAAIECAEQGASAKDMADYLAQAEKGMRVNAAFALQGDNLAACLKDETK